MAKEYEVSLPIAGIMTMVIEANSEKEAQEIAENAAWCIGPVDLIDEPKISEAIINEIDSYRRIVQGNVLYAPLNQIEVECISEGEDEED